MTVIDVHTKLVGLLGYPLGHSLSPPMHNQAFRALGLNYHYLPIEVKASDLKAVTGGISKMNFAGYNITIPHKIRIMDHLDRIDPLARVIGAVNVVTLEAGVATGYNTDGEGFIRSLEAETEVTVKGRSFFILGCGGAARSIAMTLAFKAAHQIYICNRTAPKAHDLADEINNAVRPCSTAVTMEPEPMRKALAQSEVLVNTTSVGMHPLVEQLPLAWDLIHKDLIVADIVYNPLKTRLLEVAEAKGCRIVHGLGMLVYQGAEGFRLWTAAQPPLEVMFEAVQTTPSGC